MYRILCFFLLFYTSQAIALEKPSDQLLGSWNFDYLNERATLIIYYGRSQALGNTSDRSTGLFGKLFLKKPFCSIDLRVGVFGRNTDLGTGDFSQYSINFLEENDLEFAAKVSFGSADRHPESKCDGTRMVQDLREEHGYLLVKDGEIQIVLSKVQVNSIEAIRERNKKNREIEKVAYDKHKKRRTKLQNTIKESLIAINENDPRYTIGEEKERKKKLHEEANRNYRAARDSLKEIDRKIKEEEIQPAKDRFIQSQIKRGYDNWYASLHGFPIERTSIGWYELEMLRKVAYSLPSTREIKILINANTKVSSFKGPIRQEHKCESGPFCNRKIAGHVFLSYIFEENFDAAMEIEEEFLKYNLGAISTPNSFLEEMLDRYLINYKKLSGDCLGAGAINRSKTYSKNGWRQIDGYGNVVAEVAPKTWTISYSFNPEFSKICSEVCFRLENKNYNYVSQSKTRALQDIAKHYKCDDLNVKTLEENIIKYYYLPKTFYYELSQNQQLDYIQKLKN